MKHIRKTYVAQNVLEELLGMGSLFPGGTVVADREVPDLKIIDGKWDWLNQRAELTVWSASFSPVPEGAEPPLWEPSFRRVYA